MMSLSDEKKDEHENEKKGSNGGWRPLDITSLEQCSEDDDFKKKQLAYADDVFKELYREVKSSKDPGFKPIYNPEKESGDSQKKRNPEFGKFQPVSPERMEEMSTAGIPQPGVEINENIALSPGSTPISQSGDISEIDIRENGDHDSFVSPQSHEKELVDDSEPEEISSDSCVENGYTEGFEKGLAEGFAEGYEKGRLQGAETGEQKGYDEGFEKGEHEGYDAGFLKGEADGKLVSETKAADIISSLENICSQLENAWQESVKVNESRILSLICSIAEKVVFARVDMDDTLVRDSVLHALEVMPDPREVTLAVSPEDYEYIDKIKDSFFEKVQALKTISVVSSPSVSRGGCKIESSKGRVETDVQSRLEAVFSTIVGAGTGTP